jgi:hypothetical protein
MRGGELTGLPRTVAGCDGLAAGALASDSSVHPVRGQIVLVSNPRLGVSGGDEDRTFATCSLSSVSPPARSHHARRACSYRAFVTARIAAS